MKNRQPTINILDIEIHTTCIDQTIQTIFQWIENKEQHYVCVRDVHGVVQCQHDPMLRQIHQRSGLTVPDGMPLVWIGKLMGYRQMGRVYGPDLMKLLCEVSVAKGVTHCLYGGKTMAQVQALKNELEKRYKDIQISGAFCPPFSSFKEFDDHQLLKHLRSNETDILWVGVGTPKQEYIMAHLKKHTHTNVIIGVGAAFDILLKIQPDPPEWLKRAGLQWLFRAFQNPKRLGKRYLNVVPAFIFLMLRQWMTQGRRQQL
jgi:N-acetylglucosaminyldiphosphoundecaprenol N-acetyl-beta-D-mannosaminyltransferase